MGSEEISLSSLGRSFQILDLNLKDLWQAADLKWKQCQAGDYCVWQTLPVHILQNLLHKSRGKAINALVRENPSNVAVGQQVAI